MTPRAALSIAGSDSGGGAGIQADLKTFAAHGVFATTAITAITAQNTQVVTEVLALDPELVAAQIRAVLSDLPIAAAKTGMLARAETVATVGAMAAAGELPPLVVDPVLVTSSGHSLLDEGGVRAYRDRLLPHALVATPNLREAAVLTGPRRPPAPGRGGDGRGRPSSSTSSGRADVVVKGGHLDAPSCPDVIVGPDGTSVLAARRVATGNDHGTGCSLSAAVAANLALGLGVLESISAAKAYVHRAILGAARWRLGAGHGPIDHFGWDVDDAEG